MGCSSRACAQPGHGGWNRGDPGWVASCAVLPDPWLARCRRSTHTPLCSCCSRLLDSWIADARRHGIRAQNVVSWVRRKLGTDITVFRQRKDGTLGCATPCVLCSRELARFDLRVNCSLEGGRWFRGRVTDCDAPEAVLTSGQRRMIKGKAAMLAERRRKASDTPSANHASPNVPLLVFAPATT